MRRRERLGEGREPERQTAIEASMAAMATSISRIPKDGHRGRIEAEVVAPPP